MSRSFHGKIQKKIFCFVENFPQKPLPACCKFPQKVAFMVNFHQKMPWWQISTKKFALLENFHKTLLVWKIFTTRGFVEKFPQNVALLEHFHKTLFSWKIYKKNLVGKVSPIICFVGKFPPKIGALQISSKICLFGKPTQQFALFENFHKKMCF